MDVRDWALITFTILVQMSVGAIWVLGIAHYYATRKYGAEEADLLSDRAMFALVPVIVLAFIASLLHLGNPFRAYRAVAHLGTSWLSAEIFFGVIFAVLAFAFAFLQWRKLGPMLLRTIVAWLAALEGLVLVFVMSRVHAADRALLEFLVHPGLLLCNHLPVGCNGHGCRIRGQLRIFAAETARLCR